MILKSDILELVYLRAQLFNDVLTAELQANARQVKLSSMVWIPGRSSRYIWDCIKHQTFMAAFNKYQQLHSKLWHIHIPWYGMGIFIDQFYKTQSFLAEYGHIDIPRITINPCGANVYVDPNGCVGNQLAITWSTRVDEFSWQFRTHDKMQRALRRSHNADQVQKFKLYDETPFIVDSRIFFTISSQLVQYWDAPINPLTLVSPHKVDMCLPGMAVAAWDIFSAAFERGRILDESFDFEVSQLKRELRIEEIFDTGVEVFNDGTTQNASVHLEDINYDLSASIFWDDGHDNHSECDSGYSSGTSRSSSVAGHHMAGARNERADLSGDSSTAKLNREMDEYMKSCVWDDEDNFCDAVEAQNGDTNDSCGENFVSKLYSEMASYMQTCDWSDED